MVTRLSSAQTTLSRVPGHDAAELLCAVLLVGAD